MTVRIPASPAVAETFDVGDGRLFSAPLLLLSGDLEVIAASHSFGRAFHVDVENAPGRTIFERLGSGEWDLPKLRSLLAATASGRAAIEAYEMDLKRPDTTARRLVIKAHARAPYRCSPPGHVDRT